MTKQLTGTLETSAETGRFAMADGAPAVSGSMELRGVPVYAPYGVAFSPPVGCEVLLLPVDGRPVCAGARAAGTAPAPGELRLYSMGGAEILLRNNGDICLNGVTVTADGRVVAKAFDTAETEAGNGT